MNKEIKILKKKLTVNGNNDLDKYLREKHKIEEQQKIKYLLELLSNFPDISEDKLRPDLRKYFRIAKREYYKEQLIQTNSINKRR